jgi:hypothetical protein
VKKRIPRLGISFLSFSRGYLRKGDGQWSRQGGRTRTADSLGPSNGNAGRNLEKAEKMKLVRGGRGDTGHVGALLHPSLFLPICCANHNTQKRPRHFVRFMDLIVVENIKPSGWVVAHAGVNFKTSFMWRAGKAFSSREGMSASQLFDAICVGE